MQARIAEITYAKNKEIGDLFNVKTELQQQIDQLMEESELNSMVHDENASLKKKIAEAIGEQELLKKQVGELRQQLTASQASLS